MNIENISSEFFTGINYWGSESAINMWENFKPDSIENDFKILCGAGITHLRVFPLWSVFQPLKHYTDRAMYMNTDSARKVCRIPTQAAPE